MQIWRLENSEGKGPYTGRSKALQRFWYHVPTVKDAYDEFGIFGHDWICGCPNEETFRNMFGAILKHLLNEGFEIKVYEIPEGEYKMDTEGIQLIFKRPDTNPKLVTTL